MSLTAKYCTVPAHKTLPESPIYSIWLLRLLYAFKVCISHLTFLMQISSWKPNAVIRAAKGWRFYTLSPLLHFTGPVAMWGLGCSLYKSDSKTTHCSFHLLIENVLVLCVLWRKLLKGTWDFDVASLSTPACVTSDSTTRFFRKI
jgi:hypothetical protein